MAAGTRTFQTQFLIGAKFVGAAGVAKAQQALGGLSRAAHQASGRVRGMTTAVFGGVSAQRLLEGAMRSTVQVIQKSIAAASEAQEAHDELGLSLERNAKRYKSLAGKTMAQTTAAIEEGTQALIAASEQMEATGHDAETLQKGWAKLGATGALDPKQILAQRDAFSDVLSYINGANATAEESVQLGEQWADAILRGNIALLKQMDLSTGEIAQFQHINKLIKEGTITGEEGIKRRQDLLLKFGKKFEGETKRVFERPSGKIAQMWTQVGNVFETLGQPFIDRAPEMGTAFAQLAKDVKPAADEMARITAEGLKGISGWFKENKEEIPKWFKFVEEGLGRVYNLLSSIGKLPVLFDLPAAIKRMQTPANQWLPKAQGQPPTEPSAALSQGKAGERYREAMAKQRGKSTGYPPYSPQARAVSVAEEEFYQPGGPSAMPGKINAPPTPAAPTPAAAQQISNGASANGMADEVALASDPVHVAQVLKESRRAFNRNDPSTFASRRHRNPGAMWPGTAANKFGTIGQQTLNDPERNKIATFPTETHGVAANMWNLANRAGYVGKTIGSAMQLWSGGKRSLPGPAGKKYKTGDTITREMVNDPEFMIPFFQALSSGEGPASRMTPDQWRRAYDWYQQGGAPKAGGSLKDVVKEMNIKPNGSAAGGSVSATNNITVNGVAPGRESLMASKTVLALRDPIAQLLTNVKKAQRMELRPGYV